jgi:hypothetical protein
MYRGDKNKDQLFYKRYKLLRFSILSATIKISNRKQNDKTVKWVVYVCPTNVKRAGFICFPFLYEVHKTKAIRFILYIHRFVSVQR